MLHLVLYEFISRWLAYYCKQSAKGRVGVCGLQYAVVVTGKSSYWDTECVAHELDMTHVSGPGNPVDLQLSSLPDLPDVD